MNAKGQQVTQQHLGSDEFRWEPDKSPTGPLTIIVSKHDQRIVVLRNGVEIGRSVAEINDDDPGSLVISLTHGADGKTTGSMSVCPGTTTTRAANSMRPPSTASTCHATSLRPSKPHCYPAQPYW